MCWKKTVLHQKEAHWLWKTKHSLYLAAVYCQFCNKSSMIPYGAFKTANITSRTRVIELGVNFLYCEQSRGWRSLSVCSVGCVTSCVDADMLSGEHRGAPCGCREEINKSIYWTTPQSNHNNTDRPYMILHLLMLAPRRASMTHSRKLQGLLN